MREATAIVPNYIWNYSRDSLTYMLDIIFMKLKCRGGEDLGSSSSLGIC